MSLIEIEVKLNPLLAEIESVLAEIPAEDSHRRNLWEQRKSVLNAWRTECLAAAQRLAKTLGCEDD